MPATGRRAQLQYIFCSYRRHGIFASKKVVGKVAEKIEKRICKKADFYNMDVRQD
jgi:hypothetical protein